MTLVFRWSLVLVLLAAASAFSGCDMAGQVSESMAHAAPIETEIEAAVGVKPHVFGASTGPVFFASVQFSEVPRCRCRNSRRFRARRSSASTRRI